MIVKEITRAETQPFILSKHYAQRMPSISWAFGLFIEDKLEGIVTFGKPASNPLCEGICGKEYKSKVYELNRLIVNEGLPKNTLSQFVAKSLKLLKEHDLVIVSYADSGMHHNGYIYQATNFIYTGITKERTDMYTEGNRHPRHYGVDNKHLRKVRTAKHRYVYFTNNKNEWLKLLNYPICEYPKGENRRYKLGDRFRTKVLDTTNGTSYYV